jgi:hypothetical protein
MRRLGRGCVDEERKKNLDEIASEIRLWRIIIRIRIQVAISGRLSSRLRTYYGQANFPRSFGGGTISISTRDFARYNTTCSRRLMLRRRADYGAGSNSYCIINNFPLSGIASGDGDDRILGSDGGGRAAPPLNSDNAAFLFCALELNLDRSWLASNVLSPGIRAT